MRRAPTGRDGAGLGSPTDRNTMRLRSLICAFAAMVAGVAANAQAQVTVTGRVLPAWQMEAVSTFGDANYSVEAYVAAREETVLVIRRRGRGPSPSARLSILLALRTNAQAYSLAGSAQGIVGGVQMNFGAPTAGGNGRAVAQEALGGLRIEGDRPLGSAERVVARGPRISLAGSFRSPDNALLLPVTLVIPETEEDLGEIRVVLRMGG